MTCDTLYFYHFSHLYYHFKHLCQFRHLLSSDTLYFYHFRHLFHFRYFYHFWHLYHIRHLITSVTLDAEKIWGKDFATAIGSCWRKLIRCQDFGLAWYYICRGIAGFYPLDNSSVQIAESMVWFFIFLARSRSCIFLAYRHWGFWAALDCFEKLL